MRQAHKIVVNALISIIFLALIIVAGVIDVVVAGVSSVGDSGNIVIMPRPQSLHIIFMPLFVIQNYHVHGRHDVVLLAV